MAITLGRTLGELLYGNASLSASEFAFWGEYHRRNGFPADRLEAGTAIAGAAVCLSNGAKGVTPADLIPQFTRRKLTSAEVVAGFSGLPGVKVRRKEKHGGQ